MNVTSACWKELIAQDNERAASHDNKDSKSQNPALEWNTSRVEDVPEEVLLMPIVANFDLKMTFAPPIVVERQEEDFVVCGYSTEVNVTTDINVIVSISQIKLLITIYERMLNELSSTVTSENVSSFSRENVTFGCRVPEAVLRARMSDKNNHNLQPFQGMPFDILITARKLSTMLYSREVLPPESTSENLEVNLASSTSSGAKQSDSSNPGKLVPFVYSYISQPHAIVKFDARKQKVELALHDCVVKASLKDDYRRFEDNRLVPDVSDYPVYWLETRSGKPDANSGLLPGLFTAHIDVRESLVDVDMVLGRPLALKSSLTMLDQILMISRQLSTGLRTVHAKEEQEQYQKSGEELQRSTSIPAWLHQVNVNTEQFVVVMETRTTDNSDSPVSLQFALSNLQANTVFQFNDSDKPLKIESNVFVKGCLLKIAVNRSYKSFVSPVNLEFGCLATWLPHSGAFGKPRVTVSAKSSCIQVQLVQEIVESLQAFQQHISDHLSVVLISSKNSRIAAKGKKTLHKICSNKSEWNSSESVDDLKSNWFVYNAEESETSILNIGEIGFHTNRNENYATMTWRYNECRVLTSLRVSPVPFCTGNTDGFTSANRLDVVKVRCILQHSQSCAGRFKDYSQFNLSENSACEVDLPELNDSAKIISADIWRIRINYPKRCSVGPESREPIVSPLALAASVQVNSSFVQKLVPAVQWELSVSSIRLRLFNNSPRLHPETLSILTPYTLVPLLQNHEMLALTIDDVSVAVSGFEAQLSKLHVRSVARVYADILEYRSLTMLPLLKPCLLAASLEMNSSDKTTKLSAEVELDRIHVGVSQSVIWTLNQIVFAWNPSSVTNPTETNLVAYYIICNDTQETIHFGQADADECIAVPSRCANQYSWRTHKRKQMLKLASADVDLSSAQAFDIDKNDMILLSLTRPNGRQTSVVVRIKTLSNAQKQVIVSGKMVVTNLLCQSLEIKLANSLATSNIVESNRCLPSYILDNSTTLPSLKVRLVGPETSWSQDINISNAHDGQLVRLQPSSRKDGIHVWCHVIQQNNKDVAQSLVVFSPLFVVSSQLSTSLLVNIESSAKGASAQLSLDGRGSEKQLELYGGSIVHNVTFQLNPAMQTSSPAVSLSADTIQQVNRRSLDTSDMFAMCAELLEPTDSRTWPYNVVDDGLGTVGPERTSPKTDEVSVVVIVDNRSSAVNSVDDSIPDFEQPNINVQVNLMQRWPHLNTLLIDVVPSWLIINQLCFDVILSEQNGRPWRISAGKSFAPQAFSEAFSIGILLGGRLHKSSLLTLCCEDDTQRFLPQYEGLLYREGHLQVNVPVVLDGAVIQICCLSVHSTFKHQMRIITVREQFSFCSTMPHNLEILCVCAQRDAAMPHASIIDECNATVIVTAVDVNNMRPLLLWNSMTNNKSLHGESMPLEYVLYIAVRFSTDSKRKLNSSDNDLDFGHHVHKARWSLPVKLRASKAGKRLAVAIPIMEKSRNGTAPCVLTGQLSSAIVYLCLADDRHPSMQVHNNCLQKIFFGQAAFGNKSGSVVHEELEEILNLPSVEPGSSCHYTMPSVGSQFPSTDNSGTAIPRLHLGASKDSGSDIRWSRGIDLQTDHSIFVNIPELFDLKVCVRKLGHTMHIYIDSVSRAEISAKEVRSRIKKIVTVETNVKMNNPTSPGPEDGNLAASPLLFIRPPSNIEEFPDNNFINSSLQIICNRACVVLIDESSEPMKFSEVLRMTMDTIGVSLYPTLDIQNSTSSRPLHMRNFQLSVYDMQVDNQLFGKSYYDFPVSFMKQTGNISGYQLHDIEKFSIQEKLSWLKSHSLISVSGELCGGDGISVQSLGVAIKPIQIFIEDAYIWHLLKVVDKIIPIWCTVPDHHTNARLRLPAMIKLNHAILISPLRIEHLCLEPVSILVSVRATLKMFIATNGTPLNFGRFEMRNVCSTVPQVVRAVTMHYASGAIFRAGLVVGSLEILGNPTGFVRHVGDGVADMFCMPYRGLTVGPGAFLAGITRGMASITRHLSVGTLTSITNFASSVSRNMEQLSLDSDHINRSERIRMRRPSGLSDGLRNGLTGFGLSMLGAIAGIADQPLQIFTRNQMDSASTASQARGLLMGFGKGLVGVVTKPIGGAAELVSQASLGMLHQVGLKDKTLPRHRPSEKSTSTFRNSSAKHSLKFVQTVCDGRGNLRCDTEVLVQVDATTSSVHIPSDCTLVLTSEYVLVVDRQSDQLILTLPLSEIDCRHSQRCPGTIKVVCINAESSARDTQHARIAAFIDDVIPVRTGATSPQYPNSTIRLSDIVAKPELDSAVIQNVYSFKISRASEVHLLLSQFRVVRSAATKHGFLI